MAHCRNKKGFPFIVLNDGFMELYTATGSKVSHGTRLRVQDACDEIPSYVATGFCNIVKDVEEMKSEIERYRQEEVERRGLAEIEKYLPKYANEPGSDSGK